MEKESSRGKQPHKVLAVGIGLIVFVAAGVGGFFLIRNFTAKSAESTDESVPEAVSDTVGSAEEGSEEPAGDPDYRPTLGGDFTVFEQRGDGYYIEVQVNNEYSGSCEFSIFSAADEAPTKGEGQLVPSDAVSVCSAVLPYHVEGGIYTIEAIVKSGEESVNLSRNVEP